MNPRNRKLRLRKSTVQNLTSDLAALARGGATQGNPVTCHIQASAEGVICVDTDDTACNTNNDVTCDTCYTDCPTDSNYYTCQDTCTQ